MRQIGDEASRTMRPRAYHIDGLYWEGLLLPWAMALHAVAASTP